MRTLADPRDRDAIVRRLRALRPESVRRWGSLTAPEVVCHLADALRMALGTRATTPDSSAFRRTILKWIVLRAPLRWPAGIATSPELDSRGAGTPPTAFDADHAELLALVERVVAAAPSTAKVPHPYFGRMTEAEWMRWAWLHLDHHLRQFGC